MSNQHRSPTIRYAIYTRHSTEQLEAFTSCDGQFTICDESAKHSREPNLQWCGTRFDDNGYSGATLDRPAMQKLRKVIDLGGVQRVYAVALDRLTRNMRDAVALLDEFDRKGVELKLVRQGELTSGPQNRLLKHVLAAFAQFEREMIATRIAETRSYLKRHGRRLAGMVPFGYDADPVTKQFVVNVDESRRVQAMFRRAAKGEPPKKIAFACNKQYWRTKVYYSKRSGHRLGGGKWTARAVLTILTNPVYIGRFAERKGSRPGSHEAIIDKAIFEQVQKIVASRRTTAAPRQHRDEFVLRQKIVCPRCGRFLATYVVTERRRVGSLIRRYYRCRSTAGGRARCKGIQYPAGKFEFSIDDMLGLSETWQNLLGPMATREQVDAASACWQTLQWPTKAKIISEIVAKVEIDRESSEIVVRFVPGAGTSFLPEFRPFSADAVN